MAQGDVTETKPTEAQDDANDASEAVHLTVRGSWRYTTDFKSCPNLKPKFS